MAIDMLTQVRADASQSIVMRIVCSKLDSSQGYCAQ